MGPVEHAKDLDAFGPHAVREYVGRARDNKLTGIWYATGTPGRGVISKELYSVAEPLRDFGCPKTPILEFPHEPGATVNGVSNPL